MKILYYDLETTGLHYWKNGIHQIGLIIEVDGEIKERLDLKVAPYPDAKIDEAALKVSGVTIDQVKAYPPQREVYAKLIAVLEKYADKFNKSDKYYRSGFNNASFDDPFLQAFFKQCGDQYMMSWFWAGSLDVMVLASHALADRRARMKDFKLATVARELGIEVDEAKLHDGLYDVELTREIYLKLKPTLF